MQQKGSLVTAAGDGQYAFLDVWALGACNKPKEYENRFVP